MRKLIPPGEQMLGEATPDELIDASRARPKVRVVLRPEPDVDGAEQSCILPMGPDGGGYEGADDLGRRRRPPAGRSKGGSTTPRRSRLLHVQILEQGLLSENRL